MLNTVEMHQEFERMVQHIQQVGIGPLKMKPEIKYINNIQQQLRSC